MLEILDIFLLRAFHINVLNVHFIIKLEEQKKISGMMQTSLEQKDGRMNEMQRKIEVKVVFIS